MILFAFFFIIFTYSNNSDDLPFDDDAYEVDENEVDPTIKPTPFILTDEMKNVLMHYEPKTFMNLIKLREIIVIIFIVIYILFYIYGKRSINYYIKKTVETTMNRLKTYYAAVSKRMTACSLHRYDSFSTGRTCHLGCLTTLRLTRRCDILGYIYDNFLLPKYVSRKMKSNKPVDISFDNSGRSSLTLEVIIDQAQKIPLIFHISEYLPFYANKFKLLKYPLAECENNRLSCYTDFEESTTIFIPIINEFLEEHPGLISLIEISDANRFELRAECRLAVCVSFNIDGDFENQAFSDEAVDFVMKLADKYAQLDMPKDIFDRMQKTRNHIIQEQKEEFERKGYIKKEEVQKDEKKKK